MIFALRTLVKLFLGPPPSAGSLAGGFKNNLTRSPSVTSGARSPTKMLYSFSIGWSVIMAGLNEPGLVDVVDDEAQLTLNGRVELGIRIGGLDGLGVRVCRMREARWAVGKVMKA